MKFDRSNTLREWLPIERSLQINVPNHARDRHFIQEDEFVCNARH